MRKLLCSVALIGMLAAPGAVQAQMTAGPIAAFHDDFDFGIGAFLGIPVPQLSPGFSIVPSFVYFFPPEGLSVFEINGDVVYDFPVGADSPVAPFALAGLNIGRYSVDFGGGSASSTEVGLNLGGGVNFVAGSLNPFAGAKFEIQDGTGFVIFGGLGFAVGGGA